MKTNFHMKDTKHAQESRISIHRRAIHIVSALPLKASVSLVHVNIARGLELI